MGVKVEQVGDDKDYALLLLVRVGAFHPIRGKGGQNGLQILETAYERGNATAGDFAD